MATVNFRKFSTIRLILHTPFTSPSHQHHINFTLLRILVVGGEADKMTISTEIPKIPFFNVFLQALIQWLRLLLSIKKQKIMIKKSTHPMVQMLVMFALMLFGLIVDVLLTAALVTMGVDVKASVTMRIMQTISQLLTFAIPAILMVFLYYRKEQRDFYQLQFGWRYWLMGLAGAVIMWLLTPAIDWLTVWNESWQLPTALDEVLKQMQEESERLLKGWLSDTSVWGLLLNLVVIALVPAVCEELLFRVGVQNLLVRWLKNKHVAVWATAIIFSLIHMEFYAFMPRVLMGALLGYVYVYSHSLVANCVVHFCNNATVVIAYWFYYRWEMGSNPEDEMHVSVLLTICCTVAALGLFYVTFLSNRKNAKNLKINQ